MTPEQARGVLLHIRDNYSLPCSPCVWGRVGGGGGLLAAGCFARKPPNAGAENGRRSTARKRGGARVGVSIPQTFPQAERTHCAARIEPCQGVGVSRHGPPRACGSARSLAGRAEGNIPRRAGAGRPPCVRAEQSGLSSAALRIAQSRRLKATRMRPKREDGQTDEAPQPEQKQPPVRRQRAQETSRDFSTRKAHCADQTRAHADETAARPERPTSPRRPPTLKRRPLRRPASQPPYTPVPNFCGNADIGGLTLCPMKGYSCRGGGAHGAEEAEGGARGGVREAAGLRRRFLEGVGDRLRGADWGYCPPLVRKDFLRIGLGGLPGPFCLEM